MNLAKQCAYIQTGTPTLGAQYEHLSTKMKSEKAPIPSRNIYIERRLVAEGISLGGTFTWNGRTPQGQRVATGVYYVLGSDEEGNEGIVTKVLFVK